MDVKLETLMLTQVLTDDALQVEGLKQEKYLVLVHSGFKHDSEYCVGFDLDFCYDRCRNLCAYCKRFFPKTLPICMKCKCVSDCSQEHQLSDWKEQHSKFCKRNYKEAQIETQC